MKVLLLLYRFIVVCVLGVLTTYWLCFVLLTIEYGVSGGTTGILHEYRHLETEGMIWREWPPPQWSWWPFVLRNFVMFTLMIGLGALALRWRRERPKPG
jgi:hypothetical protein